MKVKNIAVLFGVGVLGYLVYEIYKHASLFNPLSQNNLANQGFNSVYQSLTGSKGTFGSDLYGFLNAPSPGGGPTTINQYFVYDANGSLVRDSSGALLTTTSPPGSAGNPYPNPNA